MKASDIDAPKDKYGLLTLKVGHTKFLSLPTVESIALRINSIHNCAESYRTKGKMKWKVFTLSIINGKELGVLYGLKKGHT